jgi:hypothetical protein
MDQWTSFSEPGHFPLVLKPVVVGSRLNKVLINGGSGLNVLFSKTFKKMKLDITHMLTKSTSPFYGIIPGNATIPLGSVVLPVTFRETRENYCTEYIKFEVADFETSYHAILGRPAIAKFMAVPHYMYLVLKIPSPAGVLSLQGDLKISFDCDTDAVELAATNQVPNAMMEIYAASKKLASTELEIPEKSDTTNKPQPSEEVQVKAIDLGTGDNSKTTMIGVGLGPKYEDTLVNFLRANRDIFAWKPADMPGVPRNLIKHSLNVDPKATPSDNISAILPTTDGMPSRRNSPNYSRPASSEKSSILNGSPTPSWPARRTRTSGGCVSTTPTSTSTAPRTPSGCRGLIKSSTPRRAATCFASSTATPGTTRSLSRKKTRKRPCSSPRSAPTATRQCHSG